MPNLRFFSWATKIFASLEHLKTKDRAYLPSASTVCAVSTRCPGTWVAVNLRVMTTQLVMQPVRQYAVR
jgi:hypothetical protein